MDSTSLSKQHIKKNPAPIQTKIREIPHPTLKFQEAFVAAEKAQVENRMRFQAKHQTRIQTLSFEAKEMDTQIRYIYEDQFLTKQETCQKVSALIKSATEKVKQELRLKDLDCNE